LPSEHLSFDAGQVEAGRAATPPTTRRDCDETLLAKDEGNLLKRACNAIEFDQVLVDTSPAGSFSSAYNDSMWRSWRSDHRVLIERLASTVDKIPPAMLRELTELATTCEPAIAGETMLELCAEIVSGSCPEEDFGSAELFFGEIIRQLNAQSKGPGHESARASILRWLPVVDPLRIAQDPECAYGLLVGSAS
jgi:hypothetical protein